MAARKLTKKQVENINKLLKEGVSARELAGRYGVHRSVIYRRAKYEYQVRGIPVEIKNR